MNPLEIVPFFKVLDIDLEIVLKLNLQGLGIVLKLKHMDLEIAPKNNFLNLGKDKEILQLTMTR